MNAFIQMDVFFFVTTVAVVLFTGSALFILWRIARILRFVEHISQQVSFESDHIRSDFSEMRTALKKGKGRLKSFFNFFGTRVRKPSKKI